MQIRTVGLPALALVAAALGACGGGGNPAAQSTPIPTPTPCTQSTILQDAGGIPARTLVYEDFSVPETGRLDVSLDWTNASSPLGMYLTPANTCTLDEFNARSCNFVMRSESSVKPRKLSTAVNAGNYRWLIANFSEAEESVSLQIVLSKGACAPVAAAVSAAGHEAAELQLPVQAAVRR